MIHQQLYLRLSRRFVPYWKLLLLALVAMLIMALTMASLPILIKQLLGNTFIQKDQSSIQITSLTIIALFIMRGIASYLSIYTINKASSKLGADLRMDIFNKFLSLPVGYYDQLNRNNEIDTLISNINRVTHITARYITILVQDSLTIMGLIICTLYLNQEFLLLLLLVSPLILLIIQITQGHLNKFNQKNLLTSKNLVQHLIQSAQHYREIKLDGGQENESQRLGKIAEPIYHAEIQQAIVRSTIAPLGQVITALILIAITYFIMQQTLNNELSLDEVGALISAALLLIIPIQRLTSLPNRLQHEQKILEAIFSFLDQTPEQESGTQSIQRVDGKLVFEEVVLYNDAQNNPILNHFTLTIKPSEVIVFTGYTQNEKNALIDLILCLQQPTSGRILLDNYLLADIKLSNLHANIAIVSADSVLLDETVAGNIAYGTMRCANEARITAAAQASHAMEFIRKMPGGLQTSIGKEGTEVNKKQLQQIAIARALLKNSPIVILDEILTARESDSDHLFSAIETLIKDRTTLIFNQHIPHLRKIDRIIPFKNGHIPNNLE